MTEIMPVPRILILLSYQQGALGDFFFVVRSMRLLRSISAIRACAPRGALRLCCSAAAKIAPPERFSRALHGRGFQVSLFNAHKKRNHPLGDFFFVVRSMRLLRSISAIRACAPRGALRLCCSAAAKIAPLERFSRALHGRGFQVSLLLHKQKSHPLDDFFIWCGQ